MKYNNFKILANFVLSPGFYSFINPFSYEVLKNKVNTDLDFIDFYVDGSFMAWIVESKNKIDVHRVSFDYTSIAAQIFDFSKEHGLKVAFVGTTDEKVNLAASVVRDKHSLNIEYIHNGFFLNNEAECNLVISNCLKCDVVIFGMGTPYQECALEKLKQKGFQGFAYTCGGFFDQTADALGEYYPKWVNTYNLRAVYRFWKEPRRLFKRYFIIYPKFIFNEFVYERKNID